MVKAAILSEEGVMNDLEMGIITHRLHHHLTASDLKGISGKRQRFDTVGIVAVNVLVRGIESISDHQALFWGEVPDLNFAGDIGYVAGALSLVPHLYGRTGTVSVGFMSIFRLPALVSMTDKRAFVGNEGTRLLALLEEWEEDIKKPLAERLVRRGAMQEGESVSLRVVSSGSV